jgi:hypothetical protein
VSLCLVQKGVNVIVKIIEALLHTSKEVSLGVNVEKMLSIMSVDVLSPECRTK